MVVAQREALGVSRVDAREQRVAQQRERLAAQAPPEELRDRLIGPVPPPRDRRSRPMRSLAGQENSRLRRKAGTSCGAARRQARRQRVQPAALSTYTVRGSRAGMSSSSRPSSRHSSSDLSSERTASPGRPRAGSPPHVVGEDAASPSRRGLEQRERHARTCQRIRRREAGDSSSDDRDLGAFGLMAPPPREGRARRTHCGSCARLASASTTITISTHGEAQHPAAAARSEAVGVQADAQHEVHPVPGHQHRAGSRRRPAARPNVLDPADSAAVERAR